MYIEDYPKDNETFCEGCHELLPFTKLWISKGDWVRNPEWHEVFPREIFCNHCQLYFENPGFEDYYRNKLNGIDHVFD